MKIGENRSPVSVALFTRADFFPRDKSAAIADINCYERGRRTKYTDVNIRERRARRGLTAKKKCSKPVAGLFSAFLPTRKEPGVNCDKN